MVDVEKIQHLIIKSMLIKVYILSVMLYSFLAIYGRLYEHGIEFSPFLILFGVVLIFFEMFNIAFLIVSIKQRYPIVILSLPIVEFIFIINILTKGFDTFWFGKVWQIFLSFYLFYLYFSTKRYRIPKRKEGKLK